MRIFIIACAVIFTLMFITLAFCVAGGNTTPQGTVMSSEDWIKWFMGKSNANGSTVLATSFQYKTSEQTENYNYEIWIATFKHAHGYENWVVRIGWKKGFDREELPWRSLVVLRGDAEPFHTYQNKNS